MNFIFSFGLFACSLIAIVNSQHRIKVTNNCQEVVWVGTHGDDETPLNGGFKLDPRQSRTFQVKYGWTSGRVWGRTGCDHQGRNCATGDCGAGECGGRRTTFAAVTLAEFGLDKWNDLDFWDISQVDGYNLPMSIRPMQDTVKPDHKCRTVNCRFNFNACPNAWRKYDRNGRIIACDSACTNTRQERFCCPEPKYNRDTCPQPTDESRIFKNQCPDAYSHAYDDETSLFACTSKTRGSSGYEVVFCH